jgi:hypothetical protein
MAHKIVAGRSWHHRVAPKDSGGWDIQLVGAAVAEMRRDNEFILNLDNGAEIRAKHQFRVLEDTNELTVSSETHSPEVTDRLLGQVIRTAVVRPEGELEIRFNSTDDFAKRHILLDGGNWRIRFADGSICLALPEGGIELFPPTESSPVAL